MNLLEVKKGLIQLLQKEFPIKYYQYYGVDVKEGYKRPCFFTKIQGIQMSVENINTYSNSATFYITYLQEDVNEVDMIKKIDKIREIFQIYVKIGNRAIDVINFEYDFIGNDKNILEISIDLEWFDKIEKNTTNEIVGNIEIKTEMEE